MSQYPFIQYKISDYLQHTEAQAHINDLDSAIFEKVQEIIPTVRYKYITFANVTIPLYGDVLMYFLTYKRSTEQIDILVNREVERKLNQLLN